MTLCIAAGKRRITFKAPINVVCLILATAANKAKKDENEDRIGRKHRKELVKSLRQAKLNFRGSILADIQTKDGRRIIITL